MKRHTRRFSRGAQAAMVAVAVVAMLPVLAVVVFVARFALVAGLIVAAVVGGLAYVISPRLRTWLGYKLDPGLTYSGLQLDTDVAMDPAHGWVRFEAGQATVGADDMTQQLLGPLDTVELPEPGRHVSRGEPLFRLVHGDRHVTITSPVHGTVAATNRALTLDPQMLNEAPFDGGWVARVDCDDARADRRSLLRGASARQWFRREVDRLLLTLEPGAASASLPDGGRLVWNLHRQIDDATWQRVCEEFFTPHDHARA